jgi:DNA-binding transcriptional LysR family regulator
VDLNALRLFVEAAHAGSLSEAARRTGVPLPTLSRRLRVLEDELGARLVDRTHQGLTLTSAGARLFAEAAQPLAQLGEAERGLRDPSGISGKLRVSMPPHFDPLWPVFAAFGDRHPAVRFDVFVTERRVDLVADGVDVAIRVGDGGRGSYVGRALASYRHRLVAAPALLTRAPLRHPDDLASVACACWRTGAPPAWQLGDVTVPLEPVLTTNDYQHLLHLALEGRVVTELPPFLARGPLERGLLVAALPDHPLPRQPVRALVADARLQSPLIRQFLDFAAANVPSALDGHAEL